MNDPARPETKLYERTMRASTKRLRAQSTTLGDYSAYRGRPIPKGLNPTDAVYLVEYEDGFISWLLADVFERTYKEIAP